MYTASQLHINQPPILALNLLSRYSSNDNETVLLPSHLRREKRTRGVTPCEISRDSFRSRLGHSADSRLPREKACNHDSSAHGLSRVGVFLGGGPSPWLSLLAHLSPSDGWPCLRRVTSVATDHGAALTTSRGGTPRSRPAKQQP